MNIGGIEGEARRVGGKLRAKVIVWKLDIIAGISGIPKGDNDRREKIISRKFKQERVRRGTYKAVFLRNGRERAIKKINGD